MSIVGVVLLHFSSYNEQSFVLHWRCLSAAKDTHHSVPCPDRPAVSYTFLEYSNTLAYNIIRDILSFLISKLEPPFKMFICHFVFKTTLFLEFKK